VVEAPHEVDIRRVLNKVRERLVPLTAQHLVEVPALDHIERHEGAAQPIARALLNLEGTLEVSRCDQTTLYEQVSESKAGYRF
jgi:hypothetical protein